MIITRSNSYYKLSYRYRTTLAQKIKNKSSPPLNKANRSSCDLLLQNTIISPNIKQTSTNEITWTFHMNNTLNSLQALGRL